MAEFQNIFNSNRKLTGKFNSVPLKYYPTPPTSLGTKHLVKALDNPKTRRSLKKKTIGFTITLILFFFQAVFLQPASASRSAKLFSWFSLSLLFCFFIYFLFIQFQAANIARFLNGLIYFDEKHSKKLKSFRTHKITDMISILISYLGLYNTHIFPIFIVHCIHWFNPYKASLVGYWLIPYESNDQLCNKILHFCIKSSVCLFNYWIWSIGIESCNIGMVIHNLAPAIITDDIDIFQAFLRKKILATELGKVYRQLQLLTGTFNEIHSGFILPFLIFGGILLPSVSLAALIKAEDTDIISTLMLLYFTMVGMVLIVIITGGMSKMYVMSTNSLRAAESPRQTLFFPKRDQKWEIKFYRSCTLLKAMIFTSNFVDQLTPLNILNLLMSTCANFLLLV